jgi:ABC-2 type transport system ATP-binding protein
MAVPLLEIRQLQKSFAQIRAVDGISFAVARGDCLGLLGPNGAGKTTTISMVTGLLTPDAGEVLIDGARIASDTDKVKCKIGFVPQDLALFEELSARDNLRLFGSLYHLSAPALAEAMTRALALVGLADRARDKAKYFSGGMKRRLNLAAALLHDPEILLLDEPTVGVDPQSRNAIFDNIEALRSRGKTILYTTHYMEEVERLCNRVVIMDHGKVVADDTLNNLRNRASGAQRLKIELADGIATQVRDPEWMEKLCRLTGVAGVTRNGVHLVVELQDIGPGAADVLRLLHESGQKVVYFAADRPNLESVFLSLTGRQLRDL